MYKSIAIGKPKGAVGKKEKQGEKQGEKGQYAIDEKVRREAGIVEKKVFVDEDKKQSGV